MRKAKIVATIGPATKSAAMLEKIIRAGVNVCRLNFSFGSHEEHAETIRRIRAVSEKLRTPVAILQDLQGPKIRVGTLQAPVTVKRGDTLVLTGGTAHKQTLELPTTYHAIAKDCRPGKTILLADGKIILKVIEPDPAHGRAVCSVLTGGTILSGKGINLPYTDISLPAVTKKDESDALFGAEHGVDFIGMSFIRRAEDVVKLRNLLKKNKRSVPLIAKIEKPEALDNLDAILGAVDGVMVARGDLAVEISFAKVPAAQKRILHRANECGKLTIIATEMLGSMVDNPLPTRAEVSDVSNGVWDAADCLMLSNETAMGSHPVDAVKTMAEIIAETETASGVFRHDLPIIETRDTPEIGTAADSICAAASFLSRQMAHLRGIVVVTASGETARILAKYRPAVPIYALADDPRTLSRLAFYYNVRPIPADSVHNLSDEDILEILRSHRQAGKKDTFLCLRGRKTADAWSLRGLSILCAEGNVPDECL